MGKSMIGYKATDKDMKCRGFQFELGKWYYHEGPLEECKSGFHFCEQPSGPWAYYDDPGTRIFKVECEGVLEKAFEPGADAKQVCSRIRLIEELTPTGHSNTGYSNTGDRNTGDRNTGYSNTGDSNTGDRNTGHSNTGHRNTGDSNTGHRNTGDRNTGHSNTGHRNTGDSNTGHRNTGDSNTGDRNTGDSNTGDRNTGYSNTGDRNTGHSNTGDSNTGDSNTGHRNTGDRNTGYRNTGDSNTGYSNTGDSNTGDRNTGYSNTGHSNTGHGNATDHCSGFFCISEPKVICFDVQTDMTYSEFCGSYPQWYGLCEELHAPDEISFGKYKMLPGITPEKLKALHEKHLAAKVGK